MKKAADAATPTTSGKELIYMKYSKKEKESKVFAVVMLIVLLAMLALVIMDLYGVFDVPVWRPVAEYPFTNQHVTLAGAAGRF